MNKHAHNFIDLTGKKFGKLTVLGIDYKNVYRENSGKKRTIIYWLCQCECGNTTTIRGESLKNGITKSCGCYNKEMLTKHGLCDTRIYICWSDIKQRCYNLKNKRYKDYGARGIKMCDEWLDEENGFTNFYNWAIENGYKDNLTIDRIDVNGNYEPSNCRWASNKIQSRNRRNNKMIKYKNKVKCLADWCDELGLRYSIVSNRLNNYHWTIEQAFETPIKNHTRMIKYKGKIKSLIQWCKELDLNYNTIVSRLNNYHWTSEKAFETPIKNI